MIFEDVPPHLRIAAFYAEAASARIPTFVPRRHFEAVKEYFAWRESRTHPGQAPLDRSDLSSAVLLGRPISTPEAITGVESNDL